MQGKLCTTVKDSHIYIYIFIFSSCLGSNPTLLHNKEAQYKGYWLVELQHSVTNRGFLPFHNPHMVHSVFAQGGQRLPHDPVVHFPNKCYHNKVALHTCFGYFLYLLFVTPQFMSFLLPNWTCQNWAKLNLAKRQLDRNLITPGDTWTNGLLPTGTTGSQGIWLGECECDTRRFIQLTSRGLSSPAYGVFSG